MRISIERAPRHFRVGSGRDSGVYAPTVTPGTNISAAVTNLCFWMLVDGIVFVTGAITIDPVAGAIPSLVDISLPIASAFSDPAQAAGVCASGAEQGIIFADATNDRLTFSFTAVSTSAHAMTFSAAYQVL